MKIWNYLVVTISSIINNICYTKPLAEKYIYLIHKFYYIINKCNLVYKITNCSIIKDNTPYFINLNSNYNNKF